jgi:hypothetical protein
MREGSHFTAADLVEPTADFAAAPDAAYRLNSLLSGRIRRHLVPALLVGVAALIGVLGPLLLALHDGSASIPHDDTWSYSRTAQIFAGTGHVVLFDWNAMALLGLVFAFAPIGASITAQSCFVALLGLVGLAAAFDLLRTHCGPRRAALGLEWIRL